MMDRIPDDAWVVRGGLNLPADIERGTRRHPSGLVGVSVETAAGLSVAELAAVIPHGQIGVTTVGRIRALGGDVIRTASYRSPNHATVVDLTPDQLSGLLNPTRRNPAPKP